MDDKEISAIIEHINDTIIINNCGCHGMGHAKRVMNYVEILLRGIDASDHEIELGLIAAYLHDIGADTTPIKCEDSLEHEWVNKGMPKEVLIMY